MTITSPRDPLAAVVADVVDEILQSGNVVTPIEVLARLDILEHGAIEMWRNGQLPYLERAITAGLARVARILRLLRARALELGLTPVPGKYLRRGKGARARLRFSKRGDAESEQAYACHFVRRA